MGVAPAVRIAVSCVDLALSRLLPAVEKAKGVVLVTADHGNADVTMPVKDILTLEERGRVKSNRICS